MASDRETKVTAQSRLIVRRSIVRYPVVRSRCSKDSAPNFRSWLKLDELLAEVRPGYQRRLHAALALTVVFFVSLGCDRMKSRTQIDKKLSDFAFSRLETVEEVQRAVDQATSRPNAILLVHVDWAPMVYQRQRFAEFARSYKTKYPNSDLIFEYIDCTEITDGYEPFRSLPGWKALEDKNNGSSLVHGYGELVWCKNGGVLHVERPLNFESAEALIAKTESLGMGSIAN